MELISLFGAGITIYCGWQAVKDDLRSWRHFPETARQKEPVKQAKRQKKSAALDQADVAAVHWPGLSRGSV